MPNKPKLDPEILAHLHKRLRKPVSTIRPEISRLRRKNPEASLNAIAQVYAEQHNESVRRFLSKVDKLMIPRDAIANVAVRKAGRIRRWERTKVVLRYETSDPFLKKHIDEINRAYTRECYTCVFVLARKVFENLVIDILRAKFFALPELYFDKGRGKYLDFRVLLDNLYNHRVDFGPEQKKAIERLHPKLKPFKDDANEKAHSLFHIVESEKEIDDWHLDTLIDLIVTIRKAL